MAGPTRTSPTRLAHVQRRDGSYVELLVESPRPGYEQARGLAHRPSLAKNMGMFFVGNAAEPLRRFTMRGMRFPLDFATISNAGLITQIVRDVSPAHVEELQLDGPHVLEVNAGWFVSNRVTIHDLFRLGSVPQ